MHSFIVLLFYKEIKILKNNSLATIQGKITGSHKCPKETKCSIQLYIKHIISSSCVWTECLTEIEYVNK